MIRLLAFLTALLPLLAPLSAQAQKAKLDGNTPGADTTTRHLNRKAWQHIRAGQFAEGLTFARKALLLATQQKQPEQQALAQLGIGYAIQKQEKFFEAAPYFEQAKRSAARGHNDSLLSASYHWAGVCYSDQNQMARSLENFKEEVRINERAKLLSCKNRCFSAIGFAYTKLGQLDSVGIYWTQVEFRETDHRDSAVLKEAYKNLGQLFLQRRQEDQLIYRIQDYIWNFFGVSLQPNYLYKNHSLYSISEHRYNRAAVDYYRNQARFYAQHHDYKQAIWFGKMAWSVAKIEQLTAYEVQITHQLYQNEQAIGHTKEALYYLEQYVAAVSRNNQIVLKQQQLAAEAWFKNQEQQSQIRLLNENKKTEHTRQNWLWTGLLTTLLFGAIISFFYRLVRQQKYQIEQANTLLETKVKKRTYELQTALEEAQTALLRGQKLERRRVAADLHDNLGGMMSAIRLSIEAMDTSELSPNEKAVYENVLGMTRQAYNEVRLLAHNLQPEELEKFGLSEALQRLIHKLNDSQLIRFSLLTNGLARLGKELEFNMYSICLELANNIVKHSQATEATFEFVAKSDQLQLFVTDNGKGFIANNTSDGMGMRTVQERTDQMGGTLRIRSHPGEGTLFQFSIPLIPLVHA